MHKVSLLYIVSAILSWPAWSADNTGTGEIESIKTLQELATELNKHVFPEPDSSGSITRVHNRESVTRGARLYGVHCARCHGELAEGAKNWHLRDLSGNFPPPPLDGTAHTWHHPGKQLIKIIESGSAVMPAFGEQLEENDIKDIIDWFQSMWPDDVYRAWVKQNDLFDQHGD